MMSSEGMGLLTASGGLLPGADHSWWGTTLVLLGLLLVLVPRLHCWLSAGSSSGQRLARALGFLLPREDRRDWLRSLDEAAYYESPDRRSPALGSFLCSWGTTFVTVWARWWRRRHRMRLLLRYELVVLESPRPITHDELRRLWFDEMTRATARRFQVVLARGWTELSSPDGSLVVTVGVHRRPRRRRGRHRA